MCLYGDEQYVPCSSQSKIYVMLLLRQSKIYVIVLLRGRLACLVINQITVDGYALHDLFVKL